MTTNPVEDASQFFFTLAKQAERQEQAEIAAAIEFVKTCGRCDANAIASFAPMTIDWVAPRKQPYVPGAPLPKRTQTVSEVMIDSLEYRSGPSVVELTQLLLNVAFGADTVNAPAQARDLISRMATAWSANNVEVEE